MQDTPAVRMTYDAEVRVPPELMAVMSAENATAKTADGVYRFSMPQPIPSYLLALAVGDLEFRAMSERTGVYAEPSVVDEAAWEFAETEDMMKAVEELYGPYLWGRYDVLVLPPSFPFGYGALETFLTSMGRRKFLKPLYERLAETEEGLAMAKRIYEKARPAYHSVSTGAIDEILDWPS